MDNEPTKIIMCTVRFFAVALIGLVVLCLMFMAPELIYSYLEKSWR